MNVGILTFHFSDNYGAALQAYALRRWLMEQGVDVRFGHRVTDATFATQSDGTRRATALHFGRLRDRGIRSIETSSLHLDTIRDLKQINSLLATLAYPVLEEQGLLSSSRLRLPDIGTA